MFLYLFYSTVPFYFEMPIPDESWVEWLWNLELPGILIIGITLWLTHRTIRLLSTPKRCNWSCVCHHYAIASLIPAIGLSGMICMSYQFLVFMGDTPQSGETIVQWMSYWCKIGFLANCCLLYCVLLGIPLIYQVWGRFLSNL